jgi:putative transposase
LLTYRGYKTELRPTSAEVTALKKHCGAARFGYNWGLQRRIDEYNKSGRVLTSIDLHRELNQLKRTQLGWLYEVSKCAPHEALRDLDHAFEMFFRARRSGRPWPRFPRPKKLHSGIGSFRLNGVIRIGEDWIQLPRLGRIRLKERGYLPRTGCRLLSATVTERAGRWFVAVRVIETREVRVVVGPAVGVDLGLRSLATTSDGTIYSNPRAAARYARKLARAGRRLQRRLPGGRNRAKTRREIARLHQRASNIRLDKAHKVTTELTKTKSVIVIEDLAVRALLRTHRVSRGLQDAGLGRFRTLLEYKANWYGSRIIVAPRSFPSSQRCSACGLLNRLLTLSDRRFICPSCGLELDRDVNAARNLLLVAGSSSETLSACGAASSGQRSVGETDRVEAGTGRRSGERQSDRVSLGRDG